MLVEEGSAVFPAHKPVSEMASSIFYKVIEQSKTLHITLKQHEEVAREINDLLARVVALDCLIATCGDKSKVTKIRKQLSKAADMLSRTRWDMEEGKLRYYPES
jgi:hypothetical protein